MQRQVIGASALSLLSFQLQAALLVACLPRRATPTTVHAGFRPTDFGIRVLRDGSPLPGGTIVIRTNVRRQAAGESS